MGKGKRPGGRGRVWVLVAVCCAVFAAFLARLYWMQFPMAPYYARLAAEAGSVSYRVETPAARGRITDRNGTVLAEDETVYDLDLVLPAPSGTDLAQTVSIVENLTGKDVKTPLAGFLSSASGGLLPVAEALDDTARAALYAAGLPQSGAVRLTARGVRRWPDGTLLPHALGTTGAVSAEQWETLKGTGLAMDAEIGQSGLEAAYNELLQGVPGTARVTAALDGTARTAETLRAPQSGADLVLTVDAELQRAVQTALERQISALQTEKAAGHGREAKAGAAVVVDVETGGILAAASAPSYDLSSYREDYAALAADTAAPLLDRVRQGQYAPGSAFKPAVAVAALAAGCSADAAVNCTGRYLYYSGYRPGCLQYGHSGPIALRAALQYSCNIFFYDTGRRLGVDVFSAMAQRLGLAADTGVELPAASGRLTWSSDENYQAGLALMAAIGQGNTRVTPLQLAAYAAALAGQGRRPLLHYAERAVSADGETVWEYEPSCVTIPGGESVFGPVRDGMVLMAQGTRLLREAAVRCAAKTGSPQRAETLPGGGHYTDSVLIGYAPADAPRIAAAVVIEWGGGGANAVPVLRAVLDECAALGIL